MAWYIRSHHSELALTEFHAEVDEIQLSAVLAENDGELDGQRLGRSQGAVIVWWRQGFREMVIIRCVASSSKRNAFYGQ